MSKIYCTRKFPFDTAHRVMGHGGQCRFLHGHRYVCEATFEAENLDDLGMVIDFAVIKEKLGGWIKENFDHNVILYCQDEQLALSIADITNQKIYLLDSNPTCENIALHLLHDICPKVFADQNVTCIKLRLHESENSHVEVAL